MYLICIHTMWLVLFIYRGLYPSSGPLTEYCEKYAKPEDIGAATEEKSSDEELSDEEDYASSDEAVPGHPDP